MAFGRVDGDTRAFAFRSGISGRGRLVPRTGGGRRTPVPAPRLQTKAKAPLSPRKPIERVVRQAVTAIHQHNLEEPYGRPSAAAITADAALDQSMAAVCHAVRLQY